MRYIIILAISCISMNAYAQIKKVQLFGTKAFIDIPDTFHSSFEPSGYSDTFAGIYISAVRAPEDIKIVRSQFKSISDQQSLPFKSKHMVVLTNSIIKGVSFNNYLIAVGDKKESALITIVAKMPANNLSVIQAITNSIKWESKSGLNIDSVSFFTIKGLDDFNFNFKVHNNYNYTPKGLPVQKPKFTFTIGTNIMTSDYSGKEHEIINYLTNPKNQALYTIVKEFSESTIDSRKSYTLKWVYEEDGNSVSRHFTTIFTHGRLYFL